MYGVFLSHKRYITANISSKFALIKSSTQRRYKGDVLCFGFMYSSIYTLGPAEASLFRKIIPLSPIKLIRETARAFNHDRIDSLAPLSKLGT